MTHILYIVSLIVAAVAILGNMIIIKINTSVTINASFQTAKPVHTITIRNKIIVQNAQQAILYLTDIV